MVARPNNAERRKSILVVTDTPEDLEVLQAQLGGAGYDLAQTWGFDKALERVEAGAPDLVLLDMTGPEGDGLEFCKRLRSEPETEVIPVIAIIEESGAGQEERVLEIGADGFICRPFQPVELLSRVRTLLRMKDLHDKVAEQNRQVLEVNARLDQLNQEVMARNRELEQGLVMAHRLQEALMPQHYPPVKNTSFSHKYVPADAIGGDVFQISGMEDGRAAIFMADVSGHGVRAALITSIVKAVIDYIDMNDKTPTEVLKDFNSRFRSILGPLTPQIYATGVIMMMDGENRVIWIACAGHPPPLLVSKQRMGAEPMMGIDDCGPALGFLHDPDYPTIEKKLAVGDIVLAFTDGIYEVLDEKEQMFGLARLQRLVADNAHLIPRDLIQRIMTETEEFMEEPKRPDDVCMVAVEVY